MHYRRTAKRLEPAADIDLGMGLTAEVERVGLVRLGRVPFVDAEL